MNKLLNIFFLSVVLFFTNINSAGVQPKEINFGKSKSSKVYEDAFSQKLKSKLYYGWNITSSSVSFAKEKVANSFEWVAKNIDVILTKKGVVKTLMILGPLFAAYCYFFSPGPVEYLINKIFSSTAQGGAEVAQMMVENLKENKEVIKDVTVEVMKQVGDMQATMQLKQEVGQMEAFWSSLWQRPALTICLGFTKAISKGITVGIPFIMGLMVEKKIH